MAAARKELKRNLAEIELALSGRISFRIREALLRQRAEIKRQLRRSWLPWGSGR